jgi:tetratricopeptide (TPR) repeat protein
MNLHSSVLKSARRFGYFLPVPAVVAAVTYVLTLSHGVYPGLSAAFVSEAAGVISPSEAAHPIFAWVARSVASLNFLPLPVRLNLLSALCGTLCAMLLYHLVSRLILLSACEDAGGGGWKRDDALSELPAEVAAYNQRMFPIALTGGLIAAGLFIFMVPVWSAATRLDKGLFDLLLALAALSLFPLEDTPYRFLRLASSACLFVLGLFDSAVFLLLLPCYAFFLFRAYLLSENRFAIVCWIMAAGMMGSMIAVCAYAQNSTEAKGATLLRLLSSYAHAFPFQYYREFRSFFPNFGWGLLLVQTGVPGLILLFGRQLLFKDRRLHTMAAWMLVALVVIPGLLNLRIAPYFVFQPISYLPVFESALLAVVTAMAVAACLIFLQPDDRRKEEIEGDKDLDMIPLWGPRILRGLVGLLLPSLVVLVLVVPFRSYHETNMRSLFADETARVMLDQMKGRTWLISNGYLDNHLLIQATLRGQPLTLVPLRSEMLPQDTARIKRIIADSPDFNGQNRQRLQNALSLGSVRFVREWFMTDPEAGRRAMVFATPDIWTSCGYVAVPEGLAFGGIHADQKPDLTNLVEASRIFIGRVLPFLQQQSGTSGYEAALREALRMKAGLAANELGVLLEEHGQAEAAYQAYSDAGRIDPKNISAAMNAYVLASAQKTHPESIVRLSKKIKELTFGRRFQSQELTWILQNYGTVRQQAFYQQQAKMWSSQGARAIATDKIKKALALSEQTGVNALIENASFYVQSGDSIKAEACYVAALEKDPANRPALIGMSLLMLRRNKVEETKKWLQKALDAGIENDALLYPTITLAILEKDTARALTLLTEANRKFPADLRYWTLQADVLLGQGDIMLVEKSILPQMQEALKNPDHFLIHTIRGFLLKKKGTAYFKEARLSLLRALSINAAMPDLWSALFELDLALGRQDFTEVDVRNLLNIDPDHALANYLMGALLLSRGKLKESEDFLRRSIEKNPTAAACNDLGENLRRQQKLAEAEPFVRRALVLEPGLLPAIDTLACILYDAGNYDEAAQQAAKAVAAQPKYPPFQLTLLRIQIKQGDYEGVQERLTALDELQVAIPAELQKEIEALKKTRKKG